MKQLNKKNKKGIMSFNFLAMIPRTILLVLILISCVVLIRLYVTDKFNTYDLQAEIFINSIIYSKGGISYYDVVTGRNYPEIVDLKQLDEADLDNSFYFPENNLISAEIIISSDPEKDMILKTLYYNKEWYDNWEPLLRLSIPGVGGLVQYTKTLPVLYRETTGELKSGYIHYRIIQPKS